MKKILITIVMLLVVVTGLMAEIVYEQPFSGMYESTRFAMIRRKGSDEFTQTEAILLRVGLMPDSRIVLWTSDTDMDGSLADEEVMRFTGAFTDEFVRWVDVDGFEGMITYEWDSTLETGGYYFSLLTPNGTLNVFEMVLLEKW